MNRRLALLLLLCAGPAAAEFSFEYDFDANVKPWQEIQATLPAAPKEENLTELTLDPPSPHRFLVDRASVSVGEDKVVRYTVVIETSGGTRNVNYEGMRCDTVEAKIYAFGREHGEWVRNQYADWAPIRFRVSNGYQAELFRHYFCAVGGAADIEAIRRALAGGGLNRE
jgi:hypothetical protein